jgi:hypothetical protein
MGWDLVEEPEPADFFLDSAMPLNLGPFGSFATGTKHNNFSELCSHGKYLGVVMKCIRNSKSLVFEAVDDGLHFCEQSRFNFNRSLSQIVSRQRAIAHHLRKYGVAFKITHCAGGIVGEHGEFILKYRGSPWGGVKAVNWHHRQLCVQPVQERRKVHFPCRSSLVLCSLNLEPVGEQQNSETADGSSQRVWQKVQNGLIHNFVAGIAGALVVLLFQRKKP